MHAYRILQLVGSPTSDFFRELSLVYARGCVAALDDARYTFVFACVSPDGRWRFPQSLEGAAIDAAEPLDLAHALSTIAAARIDLALPQMFCHAGMTDYRALLELLKIPYLGNRPAAMALTADKAKTRAVVAAAGVPIPKGQLVRRGETPTIVPPAVVKPSDADNSDGVTRVRSFEEYDAALESAFAHSSAVLVEEFIELGREVRCGIVERNGTLVCLPLEEYFVDAVARPIRTRADKLAGDSENGLSLVAKVSREAWIVALDDPIVERVWQVARRCHVALGARHYSLFDFRIDPSGQPWFLEAGLYCSYSPQSVLATMMAAAGEPIDQFFASSLAELFATPLAE